MYRIYVCYEDFGIDAAGGCVYSPPPPIEGDRYMLQLQLNGLAPFVIGNILYFEVCIYVRDYGSPHLKTISRP